MDKYIIDKELISDITEQPALYINPTAVYFNLISNHTWLVLAGKASKDYDLYYTILRIKNFILSFEVCPNWRKFIYLPFSRADKSSFSIYWLCFCIQFAVGQDIDSFIDTLTNNKEKILERIYAFYVDGQNRARNDTI